MHNLEVKKGKPVEKKTYEVTVTFVFTDADFAEPRPMPALTKKQFFEMISEQPQNQPQG